MIIINTAAWSELDAIIYAKGLYYAWYIASF